MTTDKTYTPLHNSFEELLKQAFAADISDKQRETLHMVFFAGAAASFAALRDNPDSAETIFDELVDKSYKWAAPEETKVV